MGSGFIGNALNQLSVNDYEKVNIVRLRVDTAWQRQWVQVKLLAARLCVFGTDSQAQQDIHS